MPEQINNGGPAFPVAYQHTYSHANGDTEERSQEWAGMTLRDYFAAKVLAGMAATMIKQDTIDLAEGFKGGSVNARAAYVLADAMLAARGDA